jgi:hypothetical protein
MILSSSVVPSPSRAALLLSSVLVATGCGSSDEPGGNGGGPPKSCTEPSGGPTEHPKGAVAADEVWSADGSPHIVTADLSITAKLTLEACATVLVAPGRTLTVLPEGSIVAEGREGTPVTVDARDAGQPWASIRAIGGTLSLTWTTIRGGGDPLANLPHLQGALDVRGDQTQAPQEVLHADHLTVEGSATQGLFLREGGGFSAASQAVTVTGSAGYPVHAWANLAGTLPAGDYTGNAVDEILLSGEAQFEAITRDMTLHQRGVPYHVGHPTSAAELRVGSAADPPATLTIEPGVHLRFEPGGQMFIHYFTGDSNALGALIAVGGEPEAERIVFTSAAAAPAAGDWFGLRYGARPLATNRLEWVTVDYAGKAPSGSGSSSCLYEDVSVNDAAIRLIGPAEPTASFIFNTTIAHSASHGIDRGFLSDTKPDFMPTNTFTEVALCKQTLPGPINAQSPPCPDPPPCP